MTRQEAARWWLEIREGQGVDRGKYRDAIALGGVVKFCGNDGRFTLGVEYGVLMALAEAFGLTDDNVRGEGA